LKKDSNKIIKYLFLLIIVLIFITLFPLITNFLISFNHANTTIIKNKNQEVWVLFFGSYFGGIFSAIIGGFVSYKIIQYQIIKNNELETKVKRKTKMIDKCFDDFEKISSEINKITEEVFFLYEQLEEKNISIGNEYTVKLSNIINQFVNKYNSFVSINLLVLSSLHSKGIKINEIREAITDSLAATPILLHEYTNLKERPENYFKNSTNKFEILRNKMEKFRYEFAKTYYSDIFDVYHYKIKTYEEVKKVLKQQAVGDIKDKYENKFKV